MIPKIIHYCWFGNNKKSKLVRDCIASWKKYLPDYQIIEWNEQNTEFTHPFVIGAYTQKKWAFVSDYVRLLKIYERGGIYLDTDMLLVKNLDLLLSNEFFICAEDSKYVNGAVFGAKKKDETIYKILNQYNYIKFDINNLCEITIPKIITEIIISTFNLESFENSFKNDYILVLNSNFFYPLPYSQKEKNKNFLQFIKKDTLGIHLWNSSWIEYSEFDYFRNKEYLKGLKKVVKEVSTEKKIDLKYLKNILSSIINH